VLTARTARKIDSLDTLRSARFGLAVTAAEREGAFRLVHDQYVARGYIRPDPTGRRAGAHHALDSTRVFVGRVDDDVVATVSLIPDSAIGLPCDDLYATELAPLRARGRRIAEVSALAIHERWRDVGLLVVRNLVQMIALYADRLAGLDTLCIAVNPRHARFYESCLRFQRFGDVKAYPAVNNAPAVALRLDLAREMRTPQPASAVPFAAGLLEPSETGAVLATLRRDIAHMQSFQSVAGILLTDTVREVC
jgi:hypothetical protein